MRKLLRSTLFMAVLSVTGNLAHAQLSGVYAVNGTTSPTSFASLADAITALNTQGVGGAVTINLSAGFTETAPTGGYALGSTALNASLSATKTLTFQKSGTGANPLLTAYTGGTGTPGTAVQDGIWSLRGTDYVTIDGINLTDPNTANPATMEYGYALYKASATDGCQNVTIKNCTITLNRVNDAAGSAPMVDGSTGIAVMNATAAAATTNLTITSAAGTNSNNKFYSNTIQNCNTGIALIGYADTSPFTNADQNNDIGGTAAATGNNIINFGGSTTAANPTAGIRTLAQYGLNISYNTINNNNGSGVNHAAIIRGIFTNTAAGASETISNNTITLKGGGTSQAITAIQNAAGGSGTGNTISISNNTIANCTYTTATSGSFTGITSSASAATVNMNNNVFTTNATSSTSGNVTMVSNSGSVSTAINMNGNNVNGFTYTAANSGTFLGCLNAGGASTAALSISNNNFQSIVNAVTGSNSETYVSNTTAGPATYTFNGNTFTNLTANTTGSIIFLDNAVSMSSTAVSNMNNNSIVTAFSKTGAGGTIAIHSSNASTSTGAVVNFLNNNFSNITFTGATSFIGYNNTDGGAPTKNVNGNTFNNIIGGTSSISCINLNYNGPISIANNTITNISGQSTITGISVGGSGTSNVSYIANNTISNLSSTGTGDAVTGITSSSSAALANIDSNKISGLSTTAGAAVVGIGTTASNTRVYQNNLYDLSGAAAGSTITGISVSGTNTTFNNFVSNLRAPAATGNNAIIGLNITGGTAAGVYYNTIYLGSAGTLTGGATFGGAGIFIGSTSPSVTLNNNIVNVKGTGATGYFAAVKRTSGTAGTKPANLTANYNVYNAPYIYGEGTTLSTATNLYYTPGSGGNTGTLDALFNTGCGGGLYRRFMQETASSQEDNLVAGALPGTFTPSGASAAESTGTSIAGITTDYSNVARGNAPDIGALQFAGSAFAADGVPPTIIYTALPTTTYCTTPQTLTATIVDASGVNTTAGTKPRLYYKKSTENNAFGGGNTSATNGWKYVEGTNTGSIFTFVLDYSLLNTPVAVGDSITYFIVAQDNSTNANVGVNAIGFASGYCPASVNILAGAAPTTATPVPNGFKIIALPTLAATASPSRICISGPTTLSVNVAASTQVQWQQDNGTGTFVNITGATGASYTTPLLTASNNFKAQILCNGSVVGTSTAVAVTVNNPQVVSTTGASRCGIGPLTLTATGSTGTTLAWYSASSGGTALGTGSTFVTPTIGGTTNFYVAPITLGQSATVGPASPTAEGGSISASSISIGTYYMTFDVLSSTTLRTIDVFPTASIGTNASIEVRNSAGTSLIVVPYTVTATGGAVQTIPINLDLAPATGYRIGQGTAISLNRNTSNATYPYTSAVANITGNNFDPTYYYYIYNFKFSNDCEGPRTAVTATVIPAAPVTLSSPQAGGVCTGTAVTVNVTSTSTGYKYYWTPTDSGSSITRTPTATTTFVLTATDTTTGTPTSGCVLKDSLTVFVNPKPATPVISPNPYTLCEGYSVLYNASSTVSALKTFGTSTNTNSINDVPSPLSNYYGGTKHQMLIRASELSAAGISPNTKINSIAFNVASVGSTYVGTLPNFQININHTTSTVLTSTSFEAPGAIAYGPAPAPVSTGIVTFNLTAPFTWNGTDNIVIQTSFSTNNSGSTGVVMYNSNPGFVSTNWYRADNNTAASILSAATPGGSGNARPNMILGIAQPLGVKWLNLTGLYKDAALTQAVTASDTLSPVYAAPITNQTYRAIASVQGCKSDTSAPGTITVTPKFTAGINVTSPSATTCFPGTIALAATPSGSGLYTYQWILGTADIAGATDSVYAAPVSGAYKVRVTARATGCAYTTSAATTVTINPLPPTTITSRNSLIFCNGGADTLTAPSGTNFGYVWRKNGTPTGAGDTLRNYAATAGGDYTVTVTNRTTGCAATTTTPTTITISTPPAPIAATATTNTICSGDTLRLFTNNAQGLTYQWYLGGTAAANAIAGATDSVYKAYAPGTYYVIVSIAGQASCNTTSSGLTVTVNPLPIAAITSSSATTTFCSGGNVVLTATPTNFSYAWRVGSSAASGTNTNQTYTATASGSYTAVVTNPATGCKATSNAISVTVNPLPTATASASPTTICNGNTSTISANTGTGLTYQWFNGTGAIPGATSATYTTGIAGSYTVRVTNANNCVNTSSAATVTVTPLPITTVTPTGALNVCNGDTLTLVGPTGTGYSYQWKNGTANATGTSTSKDYKATTAGTYTLVVTASSCSATSPAATVTVLPLPTPAMTPTSATTGCDTVLLKTSNRGVTYQWSYNGNNIIGATDSSYKATATGAYSLRVTGTNGCSASTTATNITINPSPAGVITNSSPLSFCEGGAVVLNTANSASQTYQWFKNADTVRGATTSSYITSESGSYTVRVANTATGCARMFPAVTVRANPLPTPTILYNTAANLLSVLETYVSYQWYYNGQPLTTLPTTTGTYTPTANGAYSVVVKDTNGCVNISQIKFVGTLGIGNSPVATQVKVYPNPTSGVIHVDAPVDLNLVIRDITGKDVLRADHNRELDLERLADGMYLLYISDAKGQLIKTEKITKASK